MTRYVLVTGAYGGMGSAAVKALAKRGFIVFALDRKVGGAEENVIPIEADVTDPESLQRAFDSVRGVTDRLFAIIHYAGIYTLDSLIEISDAGFERMFRVNVFGAFHVNKIFFPMLGDGSRIIMTTSELAPLDPLPFTGLYAVTKSALDKYAYSLRMELQLLGIKVSVIRAGAVRTNMLGVSTDSLAAFCEKTKLYKCNAEHFRRIVDSVEAKSVEPERIADLTLSILSKRTPAFAYSVNRNSLLRLMNILPKWLQFASIRAVLK